jgi:cupin fold WbuC family metalloprotein
MRTFDNIQGDQFVLTHEIMEKGIGESKESNRKRIILPIHRTQAAGVQRMLNFVQPGTYIRPHMHPLDHATESIVMLKGAICFYRFSEEGKVLSTHELRPGTAQTVIDIEPHVWHSFRVLEPDSVLFECKKGPYDAVKDKIFADWAPVEGSDNVGAWLEKLNE